jgi:hypothetical protein
MNYTRQRLYRSMYGQSTWLHEVLPYQLTLDLNQPGLFDLMGHHENTPFLEAKWVPYDETPGRVSLDVVKGRYECNVDFTLKGYSEMVFDAFKDAIKRAWKPYKKHVMTCSSGYDSRMMLCSLKELLKEGKIDDNFIFFEADGEADLAQQCIDAIGINKKLTVYNVDQKDPNEYHALSFDFKNAWIPLNGGMVTYPVNRWFTPFHTLGLDPKETQVFTYYGANETSKVLMMKHQTINWYFWWHYHHQLSTFPLFGEMVHPFYNLELQRAMNEYWTDDALEYIKPGESISKLVIQVLYPDLMKIYKMGTQDVKNAGYNTLSEKLFKKCVEDYEKSWLCEAVGYGKATPTNQVEYNPWWGMYGLASLCDHLIEKGYKIDVA